MQNLFKIIEKNKEEIKKIWIQMANIESPSCDKKAVDSVGELIASFAKAKGLDAKPIPFNESGDGLVITLNPDLCEQPVVLMGHMDTVHKKGIFGEKIVKEEDGFLKGPGVYDCKGGLSVALLVMSSLKEAGFLNRPVKLVLSPDEEVNATYSKEEGRNYLRDNIKGAIMALNCESGSPEGKIVTGRKGVFRLRVDVTGKGAHAGSDYFNGVSAIKEAAHKIIEIEKGSEKDNITYNCGIINGGTIANAVPEKCSFIVDIRYNKKEDKKRAEEHIKKIVDTSYIGNTVALATEVSSRVPMEETKQNLELFEYIRSISSEYGLGELTKCIAGGGSDSCYSVEVGVPSLCAMGIEGHEQHTLRERAYVSSLTKRAKLIAAAIVNA